MSIKLTKIKRKNPKEIENRLKDRWYVQARHMRTIQIDDIARRIEATTAATYGDVIATIYALVSVTHRELANGRIVRFGNFGSFRVSASSEGVSDKMELSMHNLKNVKILFSPGKAIITMMKGVNLEMMNERFDTPPKF